MGRGDSVQEFGAPPDQTINQVITAESSVLIAEAVSIEGYSYTRNDGTVEHAATRQEAVKLCPVLGELALKDPQAAELLLEVAALGEAKVQENRSAKAELAPAESKGIKLVKEAAGNSVAKENTKAESLVRANKWSPQLETVKTPRPNDAEMNSSLTLASPYANRKPTALSLEQLQNISRGENNIDEKVVSVATKPPQPSTEIERLRYKPIRTAGDFIDRLQNQVHLKSNLRSEIPTGLDQEDAASFQMIKNDESSKFAEAPEESIEPAKVGVSDEILGPQGAQLPQVAEGGTDAARPGQIEASEPGLVEVYQEFAGAFRMLASAAVEAQPMQDTNEIQDFAPEFEELPPVEPVPEIVGIVSERLDALEPEQLVAVMPIIQELAFVNREVTGITQKNNSGPAEAVKSRCERLVSELFDELEVEYRAEDVRQFVSVIMGLDLPLPVEDNVEEITGADLEHDGTHEAKIRSSASADFLDAINQDIKLVLGALVVFRALFRQAS